MEFFGTTSHRHQLDRRIQTNAQAGMARTIGDTVTAKFDNLEVHTGIYGSTYTRD